MNDNKWITLDKRTSKLVIRFHVKGFDKQFYVATGLEDSNDNRIIVRFKRDLIKRDIALNQFDFTLASYQFGTTRNQPKTSQTTSNYKYDLGELWRKFTEFKKVILEITTIRSNYHSTELYINKLPTKSLDKAQEIRDWLLTNTTHCMAWQLLIRFSGCCNWAVDSGFIAQNPFEKLKIKKPKKKSNQEDYQAYTLEQRDLIISTFENHELYSYYANLIKFLFWTGARPGEVFALTWGDIQQNCTRIAINKSCNLYRVKKGTKNGKRRVFPAKEGSRLQLMLLSMKPPPGTYNPNDLVFKTKNGCLMDTCKLHHFWNGYSSKSGGKKIFYPGIVRQMAADGTLPYLKPYSTRHTFATWAIASGITPEKVALWIGDEVTTVLHYYCHPNVVDFECPDF